MCNINNIITATTIDGQLEAQENLLWLFFPHLALLNTDCEWYDSVYSPRQNLNPSLHWIRVCALCVCIVESAVHLEMYITKGKQIKNEKGILLQILVLS